MDEYLIILEKELKVFTDRIRDESLDKISKVLTDLEQAQQRQSNLGADLEKMRKENDDLTDKNEELITHNHELQGKIEDLENQLEDIQGQDKEDDAKTNELQTKVDYLQDVIDNTNFELNDKSTEIENLQAAEKDLKKQNKFLTMTNENLEARITELEKEEEEKDKDNSQSDKNERIDGLLAEIDKLQEEKIEFSEQLQFTEQELKGAQQRISSLLKKGSNEDPIAESSKDSDDAKEYLEKMDIIEKKTNLIKQNIGEIKVEVFDKLKKEYEEKHKEFMKQAHKKLSEENIEEKGKLNVLKELKGSMNESIRVLKCVTHEDHVWFLIEEDIEDDYSGAEEEIPQYWIREVDLTAEEKEYLHEYLPQSMKEEDAIENQAINKIVTEYTKKLNELRGERQKLLKECREIRYGIKVTYSCMDESFNEDAEEKLEEYEIKIIECEDDIQNLTENLQKGELE